MTKRLWRSRSNSVIAGICGGIGEYFNIDPVIVRILWLLFTFAGGSGLLVYLIIWLLVPREPVQ